MLFDIKDVLTKGSVKVLILPVRLLLPLHFSITQSASHLPQEKNSKSNGNLRYVYYWINPDQLFRIILFWKVTMALYRISS